MNDRTRRPLVENVVSIDQIGTRIHDDAVRHDYNRSGKQRLLRFYIADVPAHVAPWSRQDMGALHGSASGRGIFARRDLLRWSLSKDRPVEAVEFSFCMGADMKQLQSMQCRLVDVMVQTAATFRSVYARLDHTHPEMPLFEGLLHAAQMLGQRTNSRNFGERRRKYLLGRRMMGELSLFANTELTCYCLRHGVPILYRNQFHLDGPLPQEVLARRRELDSRAHQKGLHPIPWGNTVHSHEPAGHNQLQLVGYAEFTSPLRRYVSLVNLRQVRAHMLGLPLPYTQDHIRILAWEIDQVLWREGMEEAHT